jgi:chromosome condensin MukBEF ATPase and DNA-binding subunit MukB
MARLFLILTIVIGLGAAFLGYKATEQAKALQTDLSNTRADRDKTKQTLKKTEDDLADTKKTLEETEGKLKTAEGERDAAKMAADQAKADLAKAQQELESKTAELAKVEAARKELEAKIGPIPPEQLAAKMNELSEAKAKLETELAESKQVQESLKKKAEDLEAEFEAKDRTIAEYKQGYVRNALTGKVLAYNPGWNFVVLNLGDKNGLKSGVNMVVTRAGAMIGKVRVTTVEPTTAIADVLPGTLARGQSVQPGDTVIYQGER